MKFYAQMYILIFIHILTINYKFNSNRILIVHAIITTYSYNYMFYKKIIFITNIK